MPAQASNSALSPRTSVHSMPVAVALAPPGARPPPLGPHPTEPLTFSGFEWLHCPPVANAHTQHTTHSTHNTCASALGRGYHGDAGASKLSPPRVFSLGLLQARGCRPGCADGERSRHALVRERNFPGCASSPPLVAYTLGRGPAGGGRGQAGRSSPLPQTRPGQARRSCIHGCAVTLAPSAM